jgi:disulfide bond formation protein DsbB
MNKYISKTLIVVGIFTLSLIVSNSALAVYPTIQDCANSTWTTPVGCDKVMDSYYAGYYSNGYDYVATTRSNTYNNNYPNQYSNNYQANGTPIVNNYYYKDDSVTAKTTTSTTTKSSTSENTSSKTNTSISDTNKVSGDTDTKSREDVFNTSGSDSGLTALSFRGSGGFLPSSFWQWLLVIFLILIIVIIARFIARSHRDDVHGSPAH